jgi:hypothetical protein
MEIIKTDKPIILVCATCIYCFPDAFEDGWFCTNAKSNYVSDNVALDDICNEWESD